MFQDVAPTVMATSTSAPAICNQVRFEDESLDDEWYQLALTLNASLPFGERGLSASYFDRDFRYEADATDYEFRFNQNFSTATRCVR